MSAQSSDNLSRRIRDFDNVLFMEHEAVGILVLKNFDVSSSMDSSNRNELRLSEFRVDSRRCSGWIVGVTEVTESLPAVRSGVARFTGSLAWTPQ